MPSSELRGLVQTVLGPVPPSDLGATTTHEHLYIDFSFMYRPAQDSPRDDMADACIGLENLGWIRRNYYSNRSNLTLMDLDTMTSEVRKFSEVGGGAMVDATSMGIGRNPDALAEISRGSGVHIVMGAGHYVAAVHPADMDARTADDLARGIIGDVVVGVDGTDIKAGVIGEIGCTWPLAPQRAQVPDCGGDRPARDGRGDIDPSRTAPGRAGRDPGGAGERRRRPVPGDHGASGPYRV